MEGRLSQQDGSHKQQEAILKTKLLTGQTPSPGKAREQSVTFRNWACSILHSNQSRS